MPNRSHFNPAHRTMNYLRKQGKKHSSERELAPPDTTYHAVLISDVLNLLQRIPDHSVQLVVCDPPYNLDIAQWDAFDHYIDWAAQWLAHIPRILTDTGNLVIFGGIQFQDEKGGDLLEILHYLRHRSSLRFVNLIVWYYKSGMSAHRFFANRHEEIAWFAKTKAYTFNLDSVRIPYDQKTKSQYLKDTRLNPATVELGKNPTNVWQIPRLIANAKERVGHPTQKPVAVIRRLILALSNPGDIVLDFFAGSGTTTRVCIEENRHSIASDIDSKLQEYLEAHLAQIRTDLFSSYKLMGEDDFHHHPIFGNLH